MRRMILGFGLLCVGAMWVSIVQARASSGAIGIAVAPSVAAELHGGTDCRKYQDASCGGYTVGVCPGDFLDNGYELGKGTSKADLKGDSSSCGIYHEFWPNVCKSLYFDKVDCQ